MKLKIDQAQLLTGLTTVLPAVASRRMLPILGNILLIAKSGYLKLVATDLDISISTVVSANVKLAGSVTLPARFLYDYVRALPNTLLSFDLELDELTANLKCGHNTANIKGLSPEEFPKVPDLDSISYTAQGAEAPARIELRPDVLAKMIRQVTIAAAADESRPIFKGVLFQFFDERLTMAATDGFRLSTKIHNSPSGLSEPIEALVPGKALVKLAEILKDTIDPVIFIITPKQVLFHCDTTDLSIQLLEGKFPEFGKMIPAGYTTRAVLDTDAFKRAVKVSHLFCRDAADLVELDIDVDQLTLTARSAELGDNEVALPANIQGEDKQIGLNCSYLLDVLKVVDSPAIWLETTDPTAPVVIRPEGDDTFTYLIMPMHK